MRAVNLLPRELAPERRALPKVVPLAGAIGVPALALMLVVIGYSRAHATVSANEAQLAAARAAAAAAERAAAPAVAAPSPAADLASVRTARLAALRDVLGKEMPWDVALGQLARVLPAGVFLSDLTASSPTPAGTPTAAAPAAGSTATTFTINGYARSELDVALLLQHLQLLPSLSGVTLTSAAQTTVGKTPLVQFSVTASVQAAPTAAR